MQLFNDVCVQICIECRGIFISSSKCILRVEGIILSSKFDQIHMLSDIIWGAVSCCVILDLEKRFIYYVLIFIRLFGICTDESMN